MPVFEDSSQLYNFCVAHNVYDYRELLVDFNIEIVNTDNMPDKYLGFAIPGTRTIFMKNGITHINPEFIEAHETTHILLGSIPAAFYNSSYVSNRKVESQANEGAYFILLRKYVNNFDLSREDFILENFMNSYKIPNMYYFQVQKFISEFDSEIFT
ncbi:hypothetical protein ACPBEI_08185 [Latilactobacillus sakei]